MNDFLKLFQTLNPNQTRHEILTLSSDTYGTSHVRSAVSDVNRTCEFNVVTHTQGPLKPFQGHPCDSVSIMPVNAKTLAKF